MIKLRFIAEDDFVSWAIRVFCWSDYSHVEFVVPDGYLGARIDGGVKVRPFDYIKPARQTLAYVDCPDRTTRAVLEYARAQIGKPYDLDALFGFVFRRHWTIKDSWFCSELVAASFMNANYPLFDGPMYKIMPRDIADSPLVKMPC